MQNDPTKENKLQQSPFGRLLSPDSTGHGGCHLSRDGPPTEGTFLEIASDTSAGEGTDPFLICYLKIKCGGKRKKLGEKKKKENRSRVGLFSALKYMDEGRVEPSRAEAPPSRPTTSSGGGISAGGGLPPRPSSLARPKQPQVPILYSSVTALETCPSP